MQPSAELARFVEAVYPTAAGYCELRALPSKAQLFVPVGNVDAVAEFLFVHAHEHCYAGMATRRTPANGTLENCAELSVLWVDLDFHTTPEADARARLAAFPIQPQILVHSGRGWHLYWRTRVPFQLPAEAAVVSTWLKRLALHFGGDLAATDAARVLRVPTSKNWKDDPPRDVVLEHVDLDGAINASELDEWLPAEPTRPNGAAGAPFAAPETIVDGARNVTLYRLARALHAKRLSPAALRAALREENTARCRPPLPADEVDQIAAHAAVQPDRPDFENVEPEDIEIEPALPAGLDPVFLADATVVIAEGQEIARDGIRYRVDGLIPNYGILGLLVAFAKVGKTTLGQALAAAVAMGRDFLDRATAQSRVLIIAAEDPLEYTAYLARQLDVAPDRLTFYRAPLILTSAVLTAICQTITDGRYGLVLIASWQAVVRGLVKDENDNAGSVAVVETVKAFTRRSGVPWLIDAHSGKGEDQDDEADPSKAMRGASGAAGAADYTLSLRYADGAFGTKRRLSGKGRFVNFAPITMDYDPATGLYTCLGDTKRATADSTWQQIREMGALDETPQSLAEIARRAGLVPVGAKVDGHHRRQVQAALVSRPDVGRSDAVRRGQKTVLYKRLRIE